MKFIQYIISVFSEKVKCHECGEYKTAECLNSDRVCTKCITFGNLLKNTNTADRYCGVCGALFISRNGERNCRDHRKPMRTEQPMVDRVRDRALLEREWYNGQG